MTRALALFAVTLLAVAGHAQVRDVRPEAKGTASIAGVVETDDTAHRPLRLTQVRISSDALLTGRVVLTGNDGRFEFSGLPAGQYMVAANRGGYMSANYGAGRPGGVGAALALVDGQRAGDVRLRLSRYGSIAGVIYDQNGEPVQGMSVEALQYTMGAGRRLLHSVYGQPSFTDDRGVFEIGGLSPGKYFIAAGPSPDRGPSDVQALETADVDRALRLLASPTAAPLTTLALNQPHQSYAPVYFPGMTDFSRAQAIDLGLSERRTGIDIRLQLVPTGRLAGTIAGLDGQPAPLARVSASAVTEASSLDLFSVNSPGTAVVDAQGRFVYPALPPGAYTITARTSAVPPTGNAAGVPPLWAQADFTMSGAEQSIALALQPCMTLSGTVVFAGTAPPPASFAGLRIGMPGALTAPSMFTTTLSGSPQADGTFTVTGLVPGPYRMTATSPPSAGSWVARSAMRDGVDLLDGSLAIAPGQNIDNVVVTFTDQPTEISGTLSTPSGMPTADFFIIVFSADRGYWTPSTRRSVSTRPATNGRYVIRNLPPGEYFVGASADVQQGDWWDPEFLGRLAAGAARVTLTEHEKKIQDLKIGGGSIE